MKKKLKILNIFFLCYIAVSLLVFISYDTFQIYQKNKEEYKQSVKRENAVMPTVISMKEKPLIIHATIPYWEQEKAVAVFKENITKFDYLSLFWYTLDSNNKIVAYDDAEIDDTIIAYAKENNVKVLALITNLPDFEDSGWDSSRVMAVISTQQSRKAHIEDIITLLDSKGFDGVNIDYEELDDNLRGDFSVFIQELSRELHLRGKIVSVAIHPKSTEFLPSEDNGSRAQDLQALAQHADHLYFMTYGEHWNTSAAGPVASIPWDTKIIAYAQRLELPMQKVFLGTPLYGVEWEKGLKQGNGLLFTDIQNIEQEYGVKPVWNDQWKSPSLSYTKDGTEYVVWFENARSVGEKLKLARENHIGGVTFWHIGGEDPEVWDVVAQNTQ